MNETAIQSLSEQAIRDALREALRGTTPVAAVCDFVAGVDWSGMDAAGGAVRRLLGELEQLTTEVAEGDLEAPAFLDRIGQIESAAIASQPGS